MKMFKILRYICCFITVFNLLIEILFGFSEYHFELTNYVGFSLVLAALWVILVMLDFSKKIIFENEYFGIMLSLTLPMTVINILFFLFLELSWIVAACMIICFFCCLIMVIKHGKSTVLKIISVVLSGLMLIPVCFFTFIFFLFGNIGQNTVVQTIKSPNETHYAEVIDSNQGALGGDTIVKVYGTKGVDTPIFRVYKEQTVYIGEWGEFKDMEVYWENKGILMINGIRIEVE